MSQTERHPHQGVVTGVDFFVPGTPITQGSKRLGRAGRFSTIIETRDAELRPWRGGVASEARRCTEIGGGDWPLTGPVLVTLTFAMQRPASAPKRRRTWPISARSGDVDKLSRAILDAITSVLIADDSQVIGLAATKDFGRPGVRVQLWPCTDPDEQWIPEWTLAVTPANQDGA